MLLVATDERYKEHDPGRGHPERPERLDAVQAGIEAAGLGEATVVLPWREATRGELERVHPPDHLGRLERLSAEGGGRIDADTTASAGSWCAALGAAGAGLAAVEAMDAGAGDAAFLAVRPPGHHAVPSKAMGFCLLNNVAVTAAALTARGERVLVVDWDAHHGNGTQDIFWKDPSVLYVSLHEWPLYPGTGRLDETGEGDGAGTTMNLPLPAGATGDVYLAAMDVVVSPVVERFEPDWVLVSAGYDAHRADPLTGLALSAGDFADLTRRVVSFTRRPGRCVVFLEGGYDLEALRDGVAATLGGLVGAEIRPEGSTTGGPGASVVEAARLHWSRGPEQS
ncbi:MAG: histone deacetylase [Acidimicrobiia bacterium]|nr:histone deacetylase [Acidimicrobiia bacterium]